MLVILVLERIHWHISDFSPLLILSKLMKVNGHLYGNLLILG